jgi:hypothetical protein
MSIVLVIIGLIGRLSEGRPLVRVATLRPCGLRFMVGEYFGDVSTVESETGEDRQRVYFQKCIDLRQEQKWHE